MPTACGISSEQRNALNQFNLILTLPAQIWRLDGLCECNEATALHPAELHPDEAKHVAASSARAIDLVRRRWRARGG